MDIFPVGIAAGMIREAKHIEPGLEHLATSITFGSFTPEKRMGNPEPVFWFDEVTEKSINAVNLKNNGLPSFLDDELPLIAARLNGSQCAIEVSLAPLASGDLKTMCDMLMTHPLRTHITRVEFNAACPNHRGPHGLHPVLAYDAVAVRMLLEETAGLTGIKKALKIAPRTSPDVLTEILRLTLEYDIDAIVSSNTLFGDAFAHGKPVLSVPQGGHGGLPLLRDSVEQMFLLRLLRDERKDVRHLTLIGCGGIMNPPGLRAHRSAGADSAQVATLYYRFGLSGLTSLLTQFYTT